MKVRDKHVPCKEELAVIDDFINKRPTHQIFDGIAYAIKWKCQSEQDPIVRACHLEAGLMLERIARMYRSTKNKALKTKRI